MRVYHIGGQKSCRRNLDKSKVHLAAIRTPTGSVIGSVLLEDGRRIFRRRVHHRHVYRALDGFSLGEYALGQLQAWRVEVIRYLDDAGIYEAPLSFFCRYAVPVTFDVRKNPETQHVLPRRQWPVRPTEPNSTHETGEQPAAHVEQLALGVPA